MKKRIFQNKTLLDHDNIESHFELYFNNLVLYSVKLTGLLHVSEEIVQDQFVNLWENRSVVTIRESVKSYLYTAVRNASINYLKSDYHKKTIHLPSESEAPETAEPALNHPEMDELIQKINSSIDSLPKKSGVIFRMSRFADLSNKDIANTLDISVKTVEYHIGIALKHLRKELIDYRN